MTGPHPTPFARCLVAPVVRLVPADRRERYREEFRAELCELTRFGQIAAAASLLRGSVALRQAMVGQEVTTTAHAATPLRCRVGRHRFVGERDVNLSKAQHTSYRCAGCGTYFDQRQPEEEGFDIETQQRNANFLGGFGGW